MNSGWRNLESACERRQVRLQAQQDRRTEQTLENRGRPRILLGLEDDGTPGEPSALAPGVLKCKQENLRRVGELAS